MEFVKEYQAAVEERAAQGVPPLPLSAQQTAELVELLKSGEGDQAALLELLEERVPPGVDDAAYVKAAFLSDVAKGNTSCATISAVKAIEILGTMLCGYNVAPMVEALRANDAAVAQAAANGLKKTILVYDSFNDVEELAKTNNYAKEVLQSWANAEWFTSRDAVPEKMTVAVLKVPGETNTDDLSPAS